MFSLTIVFGPGPMVWTLMFKTEERVREELANWAINKTPLIDDFGQECVISADIMHGYMVENLEQSKLAHIERALHQARTQAKGAEIADSDPVLAQARRRAQGGMPIMQPMPTGFSPNGRFPT
jgi:hypothetical protein